jgi:YebC/PmpR family DNA-binding regulatory protein
MSGHSKWSTIKRKKAAVDAKRGKVFTRLLREVTVSARIGGGDVSANPRLRAAVTEARANNVPNDTLERAIKKGTGELEGMALEEVSYEGYAPGGVAVLVETLTDNRNRTVGEVRHVFSKHGGSLGENGCVGYLFDQRGYFLIDPESMDEEGFIELALELDVHDVATDKGDYELFTAPDAYHDIREKLAEREVEVASGALAMVPQTLVPVDASQLPKVLRLLDAMEELDDVQNVWANFDADEEALAAASADG